MYLSLIVLSQLQLNQSFRIFLRKTLLLFSGYDIYAKCVLFLIKLVFYPLCSVTIEDCNNLVPPGAHGTITSVIFPTKQEGRKKPQIC